VPTTSFWNTPREERCGFPVDNADQLNVDLAFRRAGRAAARSSVR
jgi:hypothetical protein